METQIQGLQQPEQLGVGTVSLLAPGYVGRAVELQEPAAARSAGDTLPLDAAADTVDAAVITRLRIELTPPSTGESMEGGRGGQSPPSTPQLLVSALPNRSYAVLHTDEFGTASWLFPSERSDDEQMVFELSPSPIAPNSATNDKPSRGPITKLMRHLVRVVAWTAEPLVGAGALAIVSNWESAHRPYVLRQIKADGKFSPPQWNKFGQGRTLLLIHGTFSNPQQGFNGWVGTDTFKPIIQQYSDRILTLGHPSLSQSPTDNMEWFLQQLPTDQPIAETMDIVCHSRGGLVARELARYAAAGNAPKLGRVCQVGTPNQGTLLTDPEHWTTFLDAYTNCLTLLPDNTITVLLEGILCLVKIVGSGLAHKLPGLAAMEPGGDWLNNASTQDLGQAEWFTIGTNYEPASRIAGNFMSRLQTRAVNAVIDTFFGSENDMVVPTVGCHQPGPVIKASLELQGDKIHHCNYFNQPEIQAAIQQWLQ